MSRLSDRPYFVYVLWSPSGRRFYTGISENIDHRLRQHNDRLSKWSARYRPWTLVYSQRFADYTAARRFENQLKRQKGGIGFFKATGLSRNALPLCLSGS